MNTCKQCKYWLFFYDDEPPAPAVGTCEYPIEKLPLSMQGFANRERETIKDNDTGCPCWEVFSNG